MVFMSGFLFHIAVNQKLINKPNSWVCWESPRDENPLRFGTLGDGVQVHQLPEIVIELTLQDWQVGKLWNV